MIDLIDEGFERLIHFKKLIPNMKIIVGGNLFLVLETCKLKFKFTGGDGTIGSTLDHIKKEMQEGDTLSEIKVPVAVLPLGTGNDFSIDIY